MAHPKFEYPMTTARAASPLPGQLGIPTVAPDVPKAGTVAALFADYPRSQRLSDKMSTGDKRAVKMSLSQLAAQWKKYFECSNRTMAQLLRETADMFDT